MLNLIIVVIHQVNYFVVMLLNYYTHKNLSMLILYPLHYPN